jgi:hypothetical protein
MRVRLTLATVFVSTVLLGASGLGTSAGANERPAARAPAGSVTVTGVVERLVVDRVDGEEVRYALRAEERTWWLERLPAPHPAPGTEVEVTGVERDANTLDVQSVRVISTNGATLTGTAAAPKSTRVLVLRVSWGGRPPARPTTATTKQKVLNASASWFAEVSHGRYAVTGTVTRWLKVSTPRDCFGDSYRMADQALAAARRAGYNLGSYGRFVFYLPCSAGWYSGFGSMPGPNVWLFGNLDKEVIMHEQGHNLGLPHASSRECVSGRWGNVTWSSNCNVFEYGDEIDTMGNRRAGHFNSYYKSVLGWLPRAVTVTSSKTVTLTPLETSRRGIKAIRLRAGPATYWLEYRTRSGADRSMPDGTAGVQIRFQNGGNTELLDAAPGSTVGWYDFADSHLPAGSSWTSPQNVRITVTRQTASAATVAIRFGVRPKAPDAPASVSAQAVVSGARISWRRPADNGSIIRRYEITRVDNGATRTVTTSGGTTRSFTWTGLSPTTSYRFSVRAVSQAGRSAAKLSPSVRPLSDKPTVTISSPASGASVQGIVPVRFTAKPNASTRVPVRQASLYVDNVLVGEDWDAPFGPIEWRTRDVGNGNHTLRVTVTDQAGRTATATRTVRVANPNPTVRITHPANGSTVSSPVDVTYSLTPADDDWWSVVLHVDGAWSASTSPGDPLPFDPVRAGPGAHTLRVTASGPEGSVNSPVVNVNVPAPTVTITAPGPGATLSGPFQVDYALSDDWNWSWVELLIDGAGYTSASPGDPLAYDTGWVGAGPHRLRVRASDGSGRLFESGEVEVEFVDP